MRQAEGQAEPDPVSPGPPSAPRRRWGRRRWLVLMLQLLPPLVARVFGWFSPSDAWSRGRSAMGCCWALRALLARGWRAERPCRAGAGRFTSSGARLAAGGRRHGGRHWTARPVGRARAVGSRRPCGGLGARGCAEVPPASVPRTHRPLIRHSAVSNPELSGFPIYRSLWRKGVPARGPCRPWWSITLPGRNGDPGPVRLPSFATNLAPQGLQPATSSLS
jgi:hypothetical protein